MQTGHFGTVVTLSGITSLTVSYFYDYGFFFKLGTSFSEAPTTITDHLQSWMVWLPILVLLFVFLSTIRLASFPKKVNSTENEPQAETTISNMKRRLLKVAALFGLGITALLFGFFLGDYAHPLIIAAFGAWFWAKFVAELYGRQGSLRRRSTRLAGALIAVPSIMLIAFGLGYQDAHLKVQRSQPTHRVYSLVPDYGSDTSFEDVSVVRVFATWMLILDPSDRVVWVDLNYVTKFRQLEYDGLHVRLLCRLDIYCTKN